MLEVFRDFEIRGIGRSKLSSFIAILIRSLPPEWSRERNREKEITPRLGDDKHFVFRVAGKEGRPPAEVFLAARDPILQITNIVPETIGQLTRYQYNNVLLEFKEICEPLAKELGASIYVTSDQQDVGDLLSDDAMAALRVFSANKLGASHPSDRKRWIKFLVRAHIDKVKLDTEKLSRWFIEEEHWDERRARDLASEFGFARELLEAYDLYRR